MGELAPNEKPFNPYEDESLTSMLPGSEGQPYGAGGIAPQPELPSEAQQAQTEAAPPSGPPEEPPISYDQQASHLFQGVNPEDNIQAPPVVHDPEQFADAQDNSSRIKSIANK